MANFLLLCYIHMHVLNITYYLLTCVTPCFLGFRKCIYIYTWHHPSNHRQTSLLWSCTSTCRSPKMFSFLLVMWKLEWNSCRATFKEPILSTVGGLNADESSYNIQSSRVVCCQTTDITYKTVNCPLISGSWTDCVLYNTRITGLIELGSTQTLLQKNTVLKNCYQFKVSSKYVYISCFYNIYRNRLQNHAF